MKKQAVVLLAEGFEEIEAVTPVDVLRRAGVDVALVGVGGLTMEGSRGISIKADKEIGSYDELPDAVIIPGGAKGASNLAQSQKAGALIKKAHENGKIIAAICAGPAVVLAPLGVLSGKKAASYPGCEAAFGENTRYSPENVVIDGNIITSRGPATAMEFALAIADALCGQKVSGTIARNLLYEK